jgi:aspartate aminotransferase
MGKVSRMADTLIGSEIIKIGNEVNEMIRKGAKICNLTIGDFDPKHYPIPSDLEAKIVEAYKAGYTNYPPANGEFSLRESICAFLKENGNLTYTTDEILVAGGSRPLIYAIYRTILDPGDKVVFPVPSWNNNHYCHLVGAEAIMVETTQDNNFMPRASEIAPHLKGAQLLSLCSPLNPTGTMFTQKDLEEICDLIIAENKSRTAGEKPLYLLYDQVYWTLTFGNHKHVDPINLRPELRDYTIYVDGISKAFAATGVRVGWSFGPQYIIDKMKAILGHVGAWAPKAEQVATAGFLKNKPAIDGFMGPFKNKIKESLDALHDGFQNLKSNNYPFDSIEPMGAIYLTVKVAIKGKKTPEGNVIENSMDVTSYILSHAQLAMVPFTAFGASSSSDWYRMSVGAADKETILASFARLKNAVDQLS